MKLLLLFSFFIFVWLTATIFDMNIIWFLILGVIAIYYICKRKNIKRKDVIIACLLGIASIPSNFIMGLITIPTYLGAMSVLKNSNNKIVLLSSGKKQIAISLIFAITVGLALGVVNSVGIINANYAINFSFKLQWFLDAIRAGIAEEVIFRLFFFAICVDTVKDKKLSKLESILCYLIMTLPHVLIHFSLSTINLENVIYLFLIFGIPLALLQRKRDLTSAILTHSIIDLIRFCTFGI